MENTFKTVADRKQKLQVDVKLVISVVVLSLMVLVRDLGYFYVTPFLFVAVVTLISYVLPYSSLLLFLFFYITVGISIHGVALIPLVLALIIKNRRINYCQIVFPLLILSFELFHFASYSFTTDFVRFIIYSLYITLFFFLLFDDKLNDDCAKNGIKFYILGVAVTSLIIIFHSIIVFGFQDIMFSNLRMGASFDDFDNENEMLTQLNPNQWAFYSITAFSLLLYIKGVCKYQMTRVVLMIILVFAGIMSGSRTWIILMAITLTMYFVFSEIRGKISLILATAIVFVLAMKYNSYTEAVYSRFETRFEESNISTAGHRTEIIKDYNQWLFNNPQRIIYGAGALCYTKICNIRYSTHNSVQQIIVCYGILGILIFTTCIIVYHKRYTKNNQAKFWFYIPIIICFLFSQSGQFLSPACMMLPFVATALPLKLKQ